MISQKPQVAFEDKQDLLKIISLIDKTYKADPKTSERLVALLTSKKIPETFHALLCETASDTIDVFLTNLKNPSARSNIKQFYGV